MLAASAAKRETISILSPHRLERVRPGSRLRWRRWCPRNRLVSSHHLDEVARVADRITVINYGRMIGSLDPHGVDIERAFFTFVHEDDLVHHTEEEWAR